MKTASLLLALPLVATSLLPHSALSATVSGRIKDGGGMRIAAIGLDGTATSATLPATGKFKLRVPATRAKNASLHLFSTTGEYFGPVILARKGRNAYVRLTAKQTALGNITRKSGFASVSGKLAGSLYYKTGTVQLDDQGVPLGAGRLGLVKAATASSERALRVSANADAGATQPNDPCGKLVGADCDRDGIPNSIDVDDNGNQTIDMTDPVSVLTTARLLTYSDVRPSIAYALNANTSPTPGRDAINSFLGPSANSNGLTLTFFYSQYDLVPDGGPNRLDAVWVECATSARWCAPGTGTATANGFSEANRILPELPEWGALPWSEFHGSTCERGVCTGRPASYPTNALLTYSPSGGPMQEFIWAAFVKPNDARTLEHVTPANVLTLKFRASETGAVNEIPVSLSPYFVTTPALQSYSVNGALTSVSYPYPTDGPGTHDSAPIALGSDGSLSMTLWRPQRLPLPGESAAYYDVGGLHYGLTVDSVTSGSGDEQRPTSEAGCPMTAVNGVRTDTEGLSAGFAVLAPLRDETLTDQAASAARTISFNADIAGCVRNYFPGISTGGLKARVSLLAMGEPLPHGANRTGLSFTVSLP
jgi:hypothetical protein